MVSQIFVADYFTTMITMHHIRHAPHPQIIAAFHREDQENYPQTCLHLLSYLLIVIHLC
jgi:hypothetical protein